MNGEFKKIYIFEIIFTLFIVMYVLFIARLTTSARNLISIGFLVAVFALSLYMFGYKRDKSFDRWQAIKIILATFIGTLCVLFMIGLLTGFSKTTLSFNIDTILYGFVPLLAIIVLEELIRYTLYRNIKNEKKHVILITILFIILNVLFEMNITRLFSPVQKFVFITLTVIPTISKEMLCSYMVYNFGMIPSILFKVVVNLYAYILPVFPNLTEYLQGVLSILLPFIIYLAIRKYVVKIDRLKRKKGVEKKYTVSIVTVPLLALLITLTALVSGIFKYQLIAIASNSMDPTFSKGDGVLIYKTGVDNIDIGDVLVFKKGQIVISHRVINKVNYDNHVYFYTKGDANLTNDDGYVDQNDVIGKVNSVVKYIGWPTVFINELLRKM